MPYGMLNPGSSGYYQSSGESTPAAPLPEKFVPCARSTSAINDSIALAPSWNGDVRMQPIVQRAARTVGMRYLYARGAVRMPIQRLGADGIPQPWTSGFQPNDMGPIRNCSFDYAHFQAGYPGYNLGLSFKVPGLPQSNTYAQGTRPRPGSPNRGGGPMSAKGGSRMTAGVKRALGRNLS